MFVVTVDIWPRGAYPAKFTRFKIAGANVGMNDTRDRADYDGWNVSHLEDDADVLSWVLRQPRDAHVTDFPRNGDQGHLAALSIALIEALGLTEIRVAPGDAA